MEYPDETPPQLTRKEPPSDAFFARSTAGCLLLLVTLLAVVLGTTFRYVVQRTGRTATFMGTAGPLRQSDRSLQQTTYGFTVQDEEAGLHFVRVRNHGRILAYLQRTEGEPAVRVETHRGEAVSLTVSETGLQVQEERAFSGWLLAVALLAAAIFIALLLPGSGLLQVVAPHIGEDAASGPADSAVEEE